MALTAVAARAQPAAPRDDVLRLVPPDAALCLVVNNLRHHMTKLEEASWLKGLRASSLNQILKLDDECAKLLKIQEKVKQHLQMDWKDLRDDVLGDLVVLAYRPGPQGVPTEEEGILFLWARNPDLTARLIGRLNDIQKAEQQLKEVKPIAFKGQTYFRRVEKNKTNCYFTQGPLLVFSSKEKLIRDAITQLQSKKGSSSLAAQLRAAHGEQALATLWVNPRAFDAELRKKAKQGLAPEAQVLENFLSYWQALDAVILSLNLDPSPELRLCLQARPQDMPKALRRLFSDKSEPADLWRRFPVDALLRIAGRLDAQALADSVAELAPQPARSNMSEISQRYVSAVLGLDLAKDLLPNLGPDWGFCILPGSGHNDVPIALAALAVGPGRKEAPVDQSLYKAAQAAAGLLVWGYNSNNSEPMRLQTMTRAQVEIKYLTCKSFPAGFQPAFALKDGYFLVATSPEAIETFKKNVPPVFAADETPLVHVSLSQVAQFLQARRDKMIAGLAAKHQVDSAAAEKILDGLLAALGLFDQLLLSERREARQVTWFLRLGDSLNPRGTR